MNITNEEKRKINNLDLNIFLSLQKIIVKFHLHSDINTKYEFGKPEFKTRLKKHRYLNS